ncbi:MAG: response regulator [Gammaproteobacteria bacterium]|jgi:putative two-component system response regulator|nr:response regulator [Gammaproteobacteria bacterium]
MTNPTGGKNRLLIVDDEPTNIHILSNILSDDYEIRAANNGERAIEAAKSQAQDLILLDMIMPGLDGLQVCKLLQDDEATKDIPVIFVTSMSDPANEELGLRAGAVDYISKPVSPPIVKARVKIHLQNRLTVRFLEGLLSSQTTTLEDAKNQAQSLLVFV